MKKIAVLTITATVLLTTMNLHAQALEGDTEPSSGGDFSKPLFLDPLVIVGKPDSSKEEIQAQKLAGSFDIITIDELQYEHPDETLELFSKVSGVSLSRYNQGIVNTDISIRGFAGDGATPHGKLLIDGIPANLHNGFNELDQLFPSAIAGISTFKGTSDVRYGMYNIAGNYNVRTRDDEAAEWQATYGSYNTQETQGYWGLKSGDLTHSYALGYRSGGGYRDHTNLIKRSFGGRWFYDFGQDFSLGLVMRVADYEGDSPGYLDSLTSRTNPRSSAAYANQDGGEKNTGHVSLHLNKRFETQGIDWSLKTYSQTFERQRWVRFSLAGALQERYDDQIQHGLIHTLDWEINEQWKLLTGFDFEHQDVLEQRFGTIGLQRIRDSSVVSRNFDYNLAAFGGFFSIENNPTEKIRWNIGVRTDRFSGDFAETNALGVSTDRDIYDFGWILQPKVNFFYTPIESLTLFTNFGRSFQHPFGGDLYTAGDTSARDVSLNDGYEIGAKWKPLEQFDLRASFWQQFAADEFVVVDGVSQNVGETKRSGIDLAANWKLTDATMLWSNYSVTSTEITKTGNAPANANTLGNELRGIPKYTMSTGLSQKITEKLSARIHLDGQGDYYVNERNVGGQFGSYTLANAGVDYQSEFGLFSLQLNNLLDRHYEYVFDLNSDGTGTIHSPGDGFNVSASWKYTF